MLEVWNEIRVELEQQNIRPVSPDADAITEITKRLNDSAIAVAETQVCMNAWADAWLLGWGGGGGLKGNSALCNSTNEQQTSESIIDFCA